MKLELELVLIEGVVAYAFWLDGEPRFEVEWPKPIISNGQQSLGER